MGDSLKIKVFHINQVEVGEKFHIVMDKLQIRDTMNNVSPDIQKFTMNVLPPGHLDVETNTIMDVIPISTKVLGSWGNGITHTLTGVSVILTGRIDEGEQMHEFGSSEGILSEHLVLDQPGTPQSGDFIIHLDILAKKSTNFDRKICLTMFEEADRYIQEIREQVKLLESKHANEVHEYIDIPNPGKPKVALVKQVAGQGAMYDMMLFPDEPSGFKGGTSIIDMQNMPIYLTANEYRDGIIRSMN
ncbi:MAG: proline reductase cluster protein PrdD [Streptococcaceae bacterium]|jgi:D-proline reductase (dithiol) PrdD|nr:proline reductase cluster protein PrdD [Streptococcaceae bacterium]